MKRIICAALLAGGCFADSAPVSGSTTSDGGSTSTTSTTTGGATTGGPGTTTGGSSGSTGATTSGMGSTGEPEPPSYGPCSELGTCPGVQSCIDAVNDQTVCGAPCETTLDCPPAPPGQEAVCLEIDPVALSGECLIACAGTWDQNDCPEGMNCQTSYNVCVFYAP